ncbi:MAG: PilZ domain-containing protein [Pseudomonas sp.]
MLTHPPGHQVQEQRRISRHQLDGYLQVFNRHTGRPMGFIGNISRQGMMLISQLPILLGSHYDLQLRLPGSGEQPELINFSALSRWCRPDATPGHYDSGFSITENQQAFAELALVLERYFSFSHPVDA